MAVVLSWIRSNEQSDSNQIKMIFIFLIRKYVVRNKN